jgi:DNA-binding HxlR family transcriptional regulator
MEKSDQYCERIFSLLVAIDGKIRFNKLYETLNGLGVKITKPTLIQHLHHLRAKGFILKKKEGKQNVTYQVNWKKFEELKEALEFKKVIAHNLENEKIFKSHSLEEQKAYVIGILTMEQILNLQLFVHDILEPRGKALTRLGYLLIHNLYDCYRRWFLDTCRQSRENSQKAFDLLNKEREDFQNLLFDHSAKPTQKSPSNNIANHKTS